MLTATTTPVVLHDRLLQPHRLATVEWSMVWGAQVFLQSALFLKYPTLTQKCCATALNTTHTPQRVALSSGMGACKLLPSVGIQEV